MQGCVQKILIYLSRQPSKVVGMLLRSVSPEAEDNGESVSPVNSVKSKRGSIFPEL